MKYSYTLSTGVIADFNRFHWFRYFLRPRYIWTAVLLLLFAGVNIWFSDRKLYWTVSCLMFLAIFFFVYWIQYRIDLWKSLKHDPVLSGERTFEMTNESIRIIRNTSNATYKWNRITRFGESGLSYLFYIGWGHVIIVPKSIFSSEEEQHAFEDYVKNRIRKSPKMLVKTY